MQFVDITLSIKKNDQFWTFQCAGNPYAMRLRGQYDQNKTGEVSISKMGNFLLPLSLKEKIELYFKDGKFDHLILKPVPLMLINLTVADDYREEYNRYFFIIKEDTYPRYPDYQSLLFHQSDLLPLEVLNKIDDFNLNLLSPIPLIRKSTEALCK